MTGDPDNPFGILLTETSTLSLPATYGAGRIENDNWAIGAGAAVGDVNGDGALDIVLARIDNPLAVYPGGPPALLINDGLGRFVEQPEFAAQLAGALGHAAAMGDFDSDGYTNLEEYLNEIAAWPAPQPIIFNAATNNRYAQITNWDIKWQPSKYDEAQINTGTVVVDAVGQHSGTLKIAANSGNTAQLNINSGWLKANNSVVIGGTAIANGTLNLSGGTLDTPLLTKGAAGTFNFTGNGAEGTFSFSASNAATTVPEPSSAALLGSGLVMLFGLRNRRRKTA